MNDITVTISGVNASNAGTVGATLMNMGKKMALIAEDVSESILKVPTTRKPRAAKVVEEVEEEATFEDSDEDTFVDDTADEVEEEEDTSTTQVAKLMEALRTYAAKNSVEAGKKILKKYSTNKSAPHPKFVPAADYPKIFKELGVKAK